MAEEVKPIYKCFTDRYIKYYVFKQYTLIAIYAYPRVFMMRRMISLISEMEKDTKKILLTTENILL